MTAPDVAAARERLVVRYMHSVPGLIPFADSERAYLAIGDVANLLAAYDSAYAAGAAAERERLEAELLELVIAVARHVSRGHDQFGELAEALVSAKAAIRAQPVAPPEAPR